MKILRRLLTRIFHTIQPTSSDARLHEEMESHLAMLTEEYLHAGDTPEEARRKARLKFGGAEGVRESYTAERRLLGIEWILSDLRFALRMLIKSPFFASIAILTLAIGIGANLAIFSLIDAAMLAPLPIYNPASLMAIKWRAHGPNMIDNSSQFGDCNIPNSGNVGCSFPMPIFKEFQKRTSIWSSLTASAGTVSLNLSGHGPAQLIESTFVAGNYFQTLGVHGTIGRLLGNADDKLSSAPAAVLSYAFWQKEFGGSRSVLGSRIDLNGVPFTIVGVAASSFTHLTPGKRPDLWVTVSMMPRMNIDWGEQSQSMENWWLLLLGRLQPGVTPARAQSELTALFRNQVLHGGNPLWKPAAEPSVELQPAHSMLDGNSAPMVPLLSIMMVAVGLILLIACANVAGLMLVRASRRQQEIAIRLAMGAPRRRLIQQLLTESLLLSGTGTILGAVLAHFGLKAITNLLDFPFAIHLDIRLLFFAIILSLFTGILFGLAPARSCTRIDLVPKLKQSTDRAQPHHARKRLFSFANILVISQVALSTVVLMGSGLLLRTLDNLRKVNPGFEVKNLLVFAVDPSLLNYSVSKTSLLYQALEQRISALPGVESATYSSDALLTGGEWDNAVTIENHPNRNINMLTLATGPDFFHTLKIPLLSGRLFTPVDYQAPPTHTNQALKSSTTTNPRYLPVLVNQAFVEKYFPQGQAIGKWIKEGQHSHSHNGFEGDVTSGNWEIVGVVRNIHYLSLENDVRPTVFLPVTPYGAYFEVRTYGDPHSLIAAVRNAAHEVDSNLPLVHMRTQTENISDTFTQQRLIARLTSFLGVVALLLSCLGLYGLLSYEVARRTREIGIRMALGSSRSAILKMILREGIVLTGIGVVLGSVLALVFSHYLASLLYGVKPSDPITLSAVVFLLILVSLFSCLLPAQRAMRVDPMIAIRTE